MAVIEIAGVSKQFALYDQQPRALKAWLGGLFTGRAAPEPPPAFWALKDVSFEIEAGETFGVIGDNGSGKSTLLKLITGISKPTRGRVGVSGRISALLELGAGFHPDFSGRENVFLNGAILGLKKSEVEKLFDSIVAFSELERFIDNPVKTYSSGMYMRLAFAIAIHVDPDILVIDEVLAVGDTAFQQKCLDMIHRFKHQGKTIVFVSHDLPTVREICQRAAWLHQGELRAVGPVGTVLDFYQEQVSARIERQHEGAKSLVPDGRAKLAGLKARDGDGRETAILAGHAPASFDFSLTSQEPTSALTLAARITRSDGVVCLDERVALGEIAEGPAQGLFSLSVPELRLYTGTYVLQLNVGLLAEDVDLDEKYFNFAVAGSSQGLGVTGLEAVLVREATPMEEPNR